MCCLRDRTRQLAKSKELDSFNIERVQVQLTADPVTVFALKNGCRRCTSDFIGERGVNGAKEALSDLTTFKR